MDCTICLSQESPVDFRSDCCNQSFHRQCFDKWISISHTCPSCRKFTFLVNTDFMNPNYILATLIKDFPKPFPFSPDEFYMICSIILKLRESKNVSLSTNVGDITREDIIQAEKEMDETISSVLKERPITSDRDILIKFIWDQISKMGQIQMKEGAKALEDLNADSERLKRQLLQSFYNNINNPKRRLL